jgi:hypothetical protein
VSTVKHKDGEWEQTPATNFDPIEYMRNLLTGKIPNERKEAQDYRSAERPSTCSPPKGDWRWAHLDEYLSTPPPNINIFNRIQSSSSTHLQSLPTAHSAWTMLTSPSPKVPKS